MSEIEHHGTVAMTETQTYLSDLAKHEGRLEKAYQIFRETAGGSDRLSFEAGYEAACSYFWNRPSNRTFHRRVVGFVVYIDGHQYGSSQLVDGTDVLICLDPEHSGRAIIFSADRSVYICDAICPELIGKKAEGRS